MGGQEPSLVGNRAGLVGQWVERQSVQDKGIAGQRCQLAVEGIE